MHLRSTAALFTTAKREKPSKCPLMDECVKTMGNVDAMEHYSATKEKDILPCSTWVEGNMLSK